MVCASLHDGWGSLVRVSGRGRQDCPWHLNIYVPGGDKEVDVGRMMPVNCIHGAVLDWGDFGDEWSPYGGLCEECVPADECERMTFAYRMANRHWLEQFHPEWYRGKGVL